MFLDNYIEISVTKFSIDGLLTSDIVILGTRDAALAVELLRNVHFQHCIVLLLEPHDMFSSLVVKFFQEISFPLTLFSFSQGLGCAG